MYFPPLNSILNVINCPREDFYSQKKVMVPAPLLRLLLQLAVASSDFNEVGYMRVNPDVKDAIHNRSVDSAMLHYIGYGYLEGRVGGTPDVDEHWYLDTYTDVAAAVKSGKVKSAVEHFNIIGAAEGRSPNAQYQAEALQWKHVLIPKG